MATVAHRDKVVQEEIMPEYLIETPHRDEDCLRALDEMLDTNPELLNNCYFACKSGDHRGWVVVSADSENDARELIPSFIRDEVTVRAVDRFTPDEIRSYHQPGTEQAASSPP